MSSIPGWVYFLAFMAFWFSLAVAFRKKTKSNVIAYGCSFVISLCVGAGLLSLAENADKAERLAQSAAQAQMGAATPVTQSVKVAEAPDTPEWYLVKAQMTEATVTGAEPVKRVCEVDLKGPGQYIELAQQMHYPNPVKNESRDDAGKSVIVTLSMNGGDVLYVRGVNRCATQAARLNASANQQFNQQRANLEKYN